MRSTPTAWVGFHERVGQAVGGGIADVPVGGALPPGPAVGLVVDREPFAEQEFAHALGLAIRVLEQSGERDAELHVAAADIAIGTDGAAQVLGREIRTPWPDARIVSCHDFSSRIASSSPLIVSGYIRSSISSPTISIERV